MIKINDYIEISPTTSQIWVNTKALKNDFGLNEEEIAVMKKLEYSQEHEYLPIIGYNKTTNSNALTFANPMSVAIFDYITGIHLTIEQGLYVFSGYNKSYYLKLLKVGKSIFLKTDPTTFKLCWR